MDMVVGMTDKGTSVAARAICISTNRRAGRRSKTRYSPSGWTASLLVLLSMEGWDIEAECVCGEFLWATADIFVR